MGRPPITIILAMALWAVQFAVSVARPWNLGTLPNHILWLVVLGYCLAAQWRMSRWAVLAYIAASLIAFGLHLWLEPHWLDRYPFTGGLAPFFPSLLVAALVLPHWKKLNWSLIGANSRVRAGWAAKKSAEVFS